MAVSVRSFLFALFLAGIAGTAIGVWYYIPQVSALPASTWLFVMDSPLAALLVAIVCLAAVMRSKLPNLLKVIAAIASFKVGIWTVFVLVFYREWFFSPANAALFSAMFILHVGQVLEGLLLIPSLLPSKTDFAIALAWFIGNDALDYVFGLHPALPADAHRLAVTAAVTLSLSLLTVFAFYFASKKEWVPFQRFAFLRKAADEIRTQS